MDAELPKITFSSTDSRSKGHDELPGVLKFPALSY